MFKGRVTSKQPYQSNIFVPQNILLSVIGSANSIFLPFALRARLFSTNTSRLDGSNASHAVKCAASPLVFHFLRVFVVCDCFEE